MPWFRFYHVRLKPPRATFEVFAQPLYVCIHEPDAVDVRAALPASVAFKGRLHDLHSRYRLRNFHYLGHQSPKFFVEFFRHLFQSLLQNRHHLFFLASSCDGGNAGWIFSESWLKWPRRKLISSSFSRRVSLKCSKSRRKATASEDARSSRIWPVLPLI